MDGKNAMMARLAFTTSIILIVRTFFLSPVLSLFFSFIYTFSSPCCKWIFQYKKIKMKGMYKYVYSFYCFWYSPRFIFNALLIFSLPNIVNLSNHRAKPNWGPQTSMAAGPGSHADRVSQLSPQRPERETRHNASQGTATCIGSGWISTPQHHSHQPVQLKILMYVYCFVLWFYLRRMEWSQKSIIAGGFMFYLVCSPKREIHVHLYKSEWRICSLQMFLAYLLDHFFVDFHFFVYDTLFVFF